MDNIIAIGATLHLEGISRKGKNRISELGSKWKVKEIRERIAFRSESGPWLKLEPIENNFSAEKRAEKSRWIRMIDDDFKIKDN